MSPIDFSKSKILIVDDSPANIDILLELLRDFDVRAVLDGQDALNAVSEELPDLILLDITMPGIDGFEVCRRLKADKKSKDVPVIFLSASTDDESIVRGFELGGIDYITKPYLSKEIVVRVRTQLKLKSALETAYHLSNRDALTNVSNRTRFYNYAPKLLQQAKERKIALYLAVIDIDALKQINSQHGHVVGDRVIQSCANSIKRMLKNVNLVTRSGSNEFLVIFSGSSHNAIVEQLERLRTYFERSQIVPGSDIHFSVTIALSALQETDKQIDTLIARAHDKIKISEIKENIVLG